MRRNLYTFAAATDDNNARYHCEARNRLSAYPLSADTVLSVLCRKKSFIYQELYAFVS